MNQASNSLRPRPLEGIRVVELATMVFAPSACAAMSEFGAEVIKVEPPGGGDPNRRYHLLPGMPISDLPYVFQVDNHNKQSIALDLKSDTGYEAFCKLIATADVLVTNYRPAALAKLRLTYADICRLNDRLIYALATGYGEEGDARDQPGYDSVCYWAQSAIESQIFPIDSWLGPIPFGAGDHPSGTALFGAIMLGLFQRQKTGTGIKVSTSLLANGAWANAVMLQAQLCNAQFGEKRRREDSYNFTYIHYKTRDHRVLKLSIVDLRKDWAPFCRALNRESMIDDPRFAELDQRSQNMKLLIRLLDEAFIEHDMSYWVTRLIQFDIPFAVLPTYQEAAEDPQKLANKIVVPLEHDKFGSIHTISGPITVDGVEKACHTPAPELGQHTRAVLEGLGYGQEAIERMLAAGTASQYGEV
ncbi:MAG: CoA transferase [Pirellulaceae bacterium]|nr:CoA transferase [Pirellulaceae bacterium]